ncbi:hypothetical protein L6452_06450 [Arctium lappa]|uniref:Uncharacterized protein n=1 Tax=Arctium lappa TaxID=4217 RepID=A0ACB9EJV4_ARCLA|nr:hypothetical protein L6452_06450 [Arctium lappa]
MVMEGKASAEHLHHATSINRRHDVSCSDNANPDIVDPNDVDPDNANSDVANPDDVDPVVTSSIDANSINTLLVITIPYTPGVPDHMFLHR